MADQTGEKHDADVNYLEREDTTESMSFERLNDARINAFTPEEQHKIIRRIDRRLVLTLGFLYCVSLMDRTNTGIAVVAGMGVDLVLTGNRYSIIVLVFFITYVLLQPPATVVLRKIGPRSFLPTITLLWGITMITMGFVKKWSDLIGLRVVLGIFEAGFFPGCHPLLFDRVVSDGWLIQAAPTFSAVGTRDMSCRNAMPFFTSSVRWPRLSLEFSPTVSLS